MKNKELYFQTFSLINQFRTTLPCHGESVSQSVLAFWQYEKMKFTFEGKT